MIYKIKFHSNRNPQQITQNMYEHMIQILGSKSNQDKKYVRFICDGEYHSFITDDIKKIWKFENAEF